LGFTQAPIAPRVLAVSVVRKLQLRRVPSSGHVWGRCSHSAISIGGPARDTHPPTLESEKPIQAGVKLLQEAPYRQVLSPSGGSVSENRVYRDVGMGVDSIVVTASESAVPITSVVFVM
jgi:hypothetical protein